METTLPAMTLDLFALLGVMLTTASAMEGKRDRGQVVGGGWRTDAPLAHGRAAGTRGAADTL